MPSAGSSTTRDRRAFDKVDRTIRRRRVRLAATVVVLAGLGIAAWLSWRAPSSPVHDGAPAWTPDSSALVFVSEVGGAPGDIYTMSARGSGRRQLTDHPGHDSAPAVSPDGQWIAFESDRNGQFDIYVMDRDGRRLRAVTSDPAADMAPAWSPDSQSLAFTSNRDQRASADVYIVRLDGSDLERVTDDLANWAPQFSPDGRRLALQINRDVWLIDLATRARTRLTTEPENGMNPTWSPDGQQVAFISTRHGKPELFVMPVEGGAATLLVSLPAGDVIDPRWSPDGSRIAFVLVPDASAGNTDGRTPAIYTVELASKSVSRLSR